MTVGTHTDGTTTLLGYGSSYGSLSDTSQFMIGGANRNIGELVFRYVGDRANPTSQEILLSLDDPVTFPDKFVLALDGRRWRLGDGGQQGGSSVWWNGAEDPGWEASDTVQVALGTESSDATLSALTISPGSITGFSSSTYDYTVEVDNDVTEATIRPTLNQDCASIEWSQPDRSSRSGHQVRLAVGNNKVTMTVTAEDGSATQEYSVTINREGYPPITSVGGHWMTSATDEYPHPLTRTSNGLYPDDCSGTWHFVYSWDMVTSERADEWRPVVEEGGNNSYGDARITFRPFTFSRGVGRVRGAITGAPSGSFDFHLSVQPKRDGAWVAESHPVSFLCFVPPPFARNFHADLGRLDSNLGSPRGMWSDGETAYLTFSAKDTIYAVNTRYSSLVTGSRLSSRDISHDVTDALPIALWSDGTNLWVFDNETNNLYAYSLSTKDEVREISVGFQAGGIWSDGRTIWVASTATDTIRAYALATGAADTSKDFNTLAGAGNNAPQGIWSDGVTMWVADLNDKKLYAYHMSDKSRDPSKDFNTLDAAGNDKPRDIWSDGLTMWVVDSDDRKAYAYNMPRGR